MRGLWLVTQIALGWYGLNKDRPARKAKAAAPIETLNQIDQPETNRDTGARNKPNHSNEIDWTNTEG
jgi:hypothetical protein